MSLTQASTQPITAVPETINAGAGVTQGQKNDASNSKNSSLDKRHKSIFKSNSKLIKKIVVKKRADEVYLPPPLSPYLLLIISLLYMVAADGVIREDEISLLQSITGADKSIINVALKYTQKIKLTDFLMTAPSLLKPKDKICILLNILDLMLIDGNTAEEELDYFFNLQEAFGFTDEQIKPYLSILKVKTNKKILGEFKPQSLSSPELTPHRIFGIALIYMLSSDGIVNDNEVEQLESNISVFPGLYKSSSAYTKSNSIEQFLWDARSRLNSQQSLFVLINTYDSLLSDGVADEHEKLLFDRFLATFDLDKKRFQSYANLIELKNQRPTAAISKSQLPAPVKGVAKAPDPGKTARDDDHHLRELSLDETKIKVDAANTTKAAEQIIQSNSKKAGSEFLQTGAIKESTISNAPAAQVSNIQKGKEGAIAANIQAAAINSGSHISEKGISSSTDHIQESLLETATEKLAKPGQSDLSADSALKNVQQIEGLSSADNQKPIPSQQSPLNVQPTTQLSESVSHESATDTEKTGTPSNSQLLDNANNSANLQTLDDLKSSSNHQTLEDSKSSANQQLVIDKDTQKNKPLLEGSSALGPNSQLLSTDKGVTGLSNSSLSNSPNPSNPQLLGDPSHNSLNQQPLDIDALSSARATLELDPQSLRPKGLINDEPLHTGSVDIDAQSALKDSAFKEPKLTALQARFVGIYSEIDEVNKKLDFLEGIVTKPEEEEDRQVSLNEDSARAQSAPSLDPQTELDVPPTKHRGEAEEETALNTMKDAPPEHRVNAVDQEKIEETHFKEESTFNAITNQQDNLAELDSEMLTDNKQDPELEPLKSRTKGLKDCPKKSTVDIALAIVKIKIPQQKATQTITNFHPVEDDETDTNQTPVELEPTVRPNIANAEVQPYFSKSVFDSPPNGSHSKKSQNVIDRKNLAVFTLPERIILNKDLSFKASIPLNDESEIFSKTVQGSINLNDVFAPPSITAQYGEDYLRGTNGSKVLEPKLKLKTGFIKNQRAFSEVGMRVIKVSAVIAVVAFSSLFSIEFYAPCSEQTCDVEQKGAPLMIKPVPPPLFENAFAGLLARVNLLTQA